VYCSKTDQDETCTQVDLGPGNIVLDGDPERGGAPQFSANACCGQMAAWIKMPLGMEVGLSPSDFVLDRDPAPVSPKRGGAPQLLAHVSCGQTAGWIKSALGTDMGFSPGHIVPDGDPATLPHKGAQPSPTFGPFLLLPNGWMHQDATW